MFFFTQKDLYEYLQLELKCKMHVGLGGTQY